jgi:cold shock CspA family protein
MADFPTKWKPWRSAVMSVGKVICFYKEKKFGFIRSSEGKLFFADCNNKEGDEMTLSAGDDVSFDILGGSSIAVNIKKTGTLIHK